MTRPWSRNARSYLTKMVHCCDQSDKKLASYVLLRTMKIAMQTGVRNGFIREEGEKAMKILELYSLGGIGYKEACKQLDKILEEGERIA